MAFVLVPHPEPNALTVGVRRPFGCELFCGGVSSFRGVEGGGGAPCFGSGGGISSQSNSGARSDCFTMAAVELLTASEDSGGLKCTPKVCRPVQLNSLNLPLEPDHYFLLRAGCFLCICNRVTSTDGLPPLPLQSHCFDDVVTSAHVSILIFAQYSQVLFIRSLFIKITFS